VNPCTGRGRRNEEWERWCYWCREEWGDEVFKEKGGIMRRGREKME